MIQQKIKLPVKNCSVCWYLVLYNLGQTFSCAFCFDQCAGQGLEIINCKFRILQSSILQMKMLKANSLLIPLFNYLLFSLTYLSNVTFFVVVFSLLELLHVLWQGEMMLFLFCTAKLSSELHSEKLCRHLVQHII